MRVKKSRGHIAWLTGDREAFEYRGEVYIAPLHSYIRQDTQTRGGRWESSRAHWDRYFPHVWAGQVVSSAGGRRNALPGFAHLEPPSRGHGASLPSERRRASGLALGERVTVNLKPAVAGVFAVSKILRGGRYHVRRSDGLELNVPATALRSAANPWPVELHSVTYRERKGGDGRAELYEHEFEGTRPRLAFDGRNLKIARAGSRYTVRKGWIHG